MAPAAAQCKKQLKRLPRVLMPFHRTGLSWPEGGFCSGVRGSGIFLCPSAILCDGHGGICVCFKAVLHLPQPMLLSA